MMVCAAAGSVVASVRASGPSYNGRVEQALRAAGFGGKAKREASARKPRALEVARGSAPPLSLRGRRSRAKGRKEAHASPNYRAVGMTTPSRHKWGRGPRGKREAARWRPLQKLRPRQRPAGSQGKRQRRFNVARIGGRELVIQAGQRIDGGRFTSGIGGANG
jgi:hypothetical protein